MEKQKQNNTIPTPIPTPKSKKKEDIINLCVILPLFYLNNFLPVTVFDEDKRERDEYIIYIILQYSAHLKYTCTHISTKFKWLY